MYSALKPSRSRHSTFRSWRRRPYMCLLLVSVVLILFGVTKFVRIDSGLHAPTRLSAPIEDEAQSERLQPLPDSAEAAAAVQTTTTTTLAAAPAKLKPKPKTKPPKRLCSSAIGTKDAVKVSHDVGDFEFGHKFEETPGWNGSVAFDWIPERRKVTLTPDWLPPDLKEHCMPPNDPELVGQLSLDEFINVDLEIEEINALHPEVEEGGAWSPFPPPASRSEEATDCPKVAIIIPYRNRWTHLKVTLNFLHTLLQRQQINYRIFVAEQFGNNTFSRGVVSNAAFATLMGSGIASSNYDCIILQDVDLLPENDYNLYNCEESPRHFAVAMDKFNYTMPYDRYFGGVLGLTPEHFLLINGYPNTYWGWGGEDDDLFFRTEAVGLNISRFPLQIAHYRMLDHKNEKRLPNQHTCDLLRTARTRYPLDGLSTLRFRLLSIDYEKLYTRLLIDVGLPDRVHYPES